MDTLCIHNHLMTHSHPMPIISRHATMPAIFQTTHPSEEEMNLQQHEGLKRNKFRIYLHQHQDHSLGQHPKPTQVIHIFYRLYLYFHQLVHQ